MSFEFLPTWFKAAVGCAVMLAILIVGFSQTSKKANKGNSSKNNSDT